MKIEHVVQDYDEQGNYIRTWVPELRKLPAPNIFEPSKLSRADQERFGVQIGVCLSGAASLSFSYHCCVNRTMFPEYPMCRVGWVVASKAHQVDVIKTEK